MAKNQVTTHFVLRSMQERNYSPGGSQVENGTSTTQVEQILLSLP